MALCKWYEIALIALCSLTSQVPCLTEETECTQTISTTGYRWMNVPERVPSLEDEQQAIVKWDFWYMMPFTKGKILTSLSFSICYLLFPSSFRRL